MMKQCALKWAIALAALCVAAAPLASGEEAAWSTIATEPYLIKARSVSDSTVKEVWAEVDFDVSVQDVEETLRDAPNFKKFMPYVVESRFLGKPEADGAQHSYIRLDFGGMATARDYIVKVWFDHTSLNGGDTFENHWVAVPDKLPGRANTLRLKINSGLWKVTATGPSTSHGVYKFIVDPGGWIPGWATNMGNEKGVSDTVRAILTEARKRASVRQAKSAK